MHGEESYLDPSKIVHALKEGIRVVGGHGW